MSDQININLPDGRIIQFNAKQDALVFTARAARPEDFEALFERLYGTKDKATSMRNYYRTDRWQRELLDVMQRTRLNDGTLLFDVVAAEAKARAKR